MPAQSAARETGVCTDGTERMERGGGGGGGAEGGGARARSGEEDKGVCNSPKIHIRKIT